MNLQEFKVQLFTAAKAAGLEEFELYCKRGAALTIKVFNAEIDEYKNSDSFGASFRGKVNGKMGYAFSEKIDESVVGFLVKSVQENAAIIEDDDEEFIYGGDPSYPEVKTYNPALNDVGVTGIVDAAFALEKAGLEYDPRAQSMPFCMVGSSDSEILIANSKGLDVSTKNNAVFAVANVLVNDNGDVKTTYEMVSGLDFDKLDTKKLGEDAAKKSLANLGAIQPKSGKYPAILDPFAMGLMLSTWADSFSAEAAHKGFSLLAGKVGEDIAASCVTLVDDPLMPEKYASTPFDSEGVASRTKTVIDAGNFKTFLHNTKTAAKDGVAPTGNGFKADYKTAVDVIPTNFYIAPGSLSHDELLAKMKDGILITNLEGLHAGANAITGDFSISAGGFEVEGGKVTKPVEQITISGNFFEMLKNVEAVGKNLEFNVAMLMGGPSNPGSPSVFIKSMDISGA